MSDEAKYSIDDLLYLMSRLRDPETGCPWDCEQDYESLAKFTLEEAYEVVDAIERGDDGHLPEELGDLLFQVVFYAQMGMEEGRFDFSEIVQRLISKLVSRHPHVFPEGTLHSRRDSNIVPQHSDIVSTWEKKKHHERQGKGYQRLLADIPVAMPALMRAEKIQRRAARAGFDWSAIQGVLAKINEEIEEFTAELQSGNEDAMADELGDILFSVVNLARHAGCDAEKTLRRATRKFEQRFALMEDIAAESGWQLSELETGQLETLWDEAKVLSGSDSG